MHLLWSIYTEVGLSMTFIMFILYVIYNIYNICDEPRKGRKVNENALWYQLISSLF